MHVLLWTLLWCGLATPPLGERGAITGVVVNGSAGGAAVSRASVVLRVEDGGTLFVVAETRSDERGRYRFDNLPLDDAMEYLPGANHDGIHYPGARVRLNARRPTADQNITVYATTTQPGDLVASHHEIEVQAEAGVLVVTERIVIANRRRWTYIGPEQTGAESPTTLRLALPEGFTRVTFDKEFFGRQFRVVRGGLETSIPWTPGACELKFTYRLPFDGRAYSLSRPLDLPSEHVRVRVARGEIPEVACNLPAGSSDESATIFEAVGTLLSAGHQVRVDLGQLPTPWSTKGRWIAVAVLAASVVGTAGVLVLRRRHPQTRDAGATAVRSLPAGSADRHAA